MAPFCRVSLLASPPSLPVFLMWSHLQPRVTAGGKRGQDSRAECEAGLRSAGCAVRIQDDEPMPGAELGTGTGFGWRRTAPETNGPGFPSSGAAVTSCDPRSVQVSQRVDSRATPTRRLGFRSRVRIWKRGLPCTVSRPSLQMFLVKPHSWTGITQGGSSWLGSWPGCGVRIKENGPEPETEPGGWSYFGGMWTAVPIP